MISRVKALLLVIVILLPSLMTWGCNKDIPRDGETNLTDSEGNCFSVSSDDRIVCAYGSFAECWLLSGGTLAGVTEDAVSERGLSIDGSVKIIGTVKSVNLELLLSVDPDLVILSADLAVHRQLASELSKIGIPAALFRMDSFADYASMMAQFCSVNGGDEYYKRNVTCVKENIDGIVSSVPEKEKGKTSLIMRVYSNGIKVKTDNLAEDVANDLGCVSLAQKYPSLLTDLSLETIVTEDPDYIFVLTMGDESAAMSYLDSYIESNPAFASLSAVKNGNLEILPKELFHYKPNNKWDKSYEYLAQIIYPQLFE